jgi:hypothetical protein
MQNSYVTQNGLKQNVWKQSVWKHYENISWKQRNKFPYFYVLYSIIKWHPYTHTHLMELPESEMIIPTNRNRP